MIYSKYLPNGTECVATIDKNSKVEVPKDVYNDAVAALELRIANDELQDIHDPEEAKSFILCGAYTYDTAKVIAQSKNVEALKFNDKTGEIMSESPAGVTAEITLAIAIWNGDDYETAIERAIFARLNTGIKFLPSALAESVDNLKINDGLKIKPNIANKIAIKSVDFIYFL